MRSAWLRWSFIIFVVLVLIALLGCARRARIMPTPGPTDTPVVYPATYTPVGTPAPPTKTPPPPTRVPDPATLEVLRSIDRTNGLNVYSAHIETIVNSPDVSLLGERPGTDIRFLTMDGNVDRENSKWVISGAWIGFTTGDPANALEVRTLGDRAYIHGALPSLGADQKRWYSTRVARDDELYNAVGTHSSLHLFANANVSLPTFHTDGAEVLEKRSCTIYRADKTEAGKYYNDLQAQTLLSYNTLPRYKLVSGQGVLDIWICEDGYIHKIVMDYEFQCSCSAKSRARFHADVRLWDMNIIIPVQVPDNAVPLPNPFMFPTPTPEIETS